jgi:hypothetical protein
LPIGDQSLSKSSPDPRQKFQNTIHQILLQKKKKKNHFSTKSTPKIPLKTH